MNLSNTPLNATELLTTSFECLSTSRQANRDEEQNRDGSFYFELIESNPKKKGVNYLTVSAEGLEIRNSTDSFILLEPNEQKYPEIWIIQIKIHNKEQSYEILKQANYFLKYGYRVLFIYGKLNHAVKRYEYLEKLCYQTTHDQNVERLLRGMNVFVYSGINNITEYFEMLEFSKKDYEDISLDYVIRDNKDDIKEYNYEWKDIADIENANKKNIEYPTDSFGELAPLIREIHDSSGLSEPMIGLSILSVLSGVAKQCFCRNHNFVVYSLIGAEPNTGKDMLTNYLMNPIEKYYQEELEYYQEYKNTHKAKGVTVMEKEPNRPFVNSVGSIKGILKRMSENIDEDNGSLTISSTEGRGFFLSLGSKDQMNQSLSLLNDFWSGKPTEYLTKDIQIKFRKDTKLSIFLMTQHDDFFKQLGNEEFWRSGLLNRFIIYKEPKPNYNNIRKIIFNESSEYYKTYEKKIELFLHNNMDKEIFISNEDFELLNEYRIHYMQLRGDKLNPNYIEYDNAEIGGFSGRALDHIIRIACLLCTYENIEGKKRASKWDTDLFVVEYFPDDDKPVKARITDTYRTDTKGQSGGKPSYRCSVEKLVLSRTYIVRAKSLFEFYLENLKQIMYSSENDERFEKILNKVYELKAKGSVATKKVLYGKKTLRQTDNPNQSARMVEYEEVIGALCEMGYLKIVYDEKQEVIQIHPKYKPK